jgi:hypothetical protein
MQHKRRNDPPGKPRARSDRCFNRNGAWYIATRERVPIGPYPTRSAAELQAEAMSPYLAVLDGADDREMAPTFVQEVAKRRTL